MTRGAARVGGAGLELGRMLVTLLWVTGAAAATLAFLGAVPARVAGEARGVRRVRTLDDAERILGHRLAVPAYFPARLAWPPAELRVAGGRRGSAAMEIRERDGGAPAIEIVQATEAGVPIAPVLLEGRSVLRESRTVVGTRPATLADVLHGGSTWRELAWDVDGRAVVLRTRGELDEAYRMARTLRREGPR
jgi:hypothetical protein